MFTIKWSQLISPLAPTTVAVPGLGRVSVRNEDIQFAMQWIGKGGVTDLEFETIEASAINEAVPGFVLGRAVPLGPNLPAASSTSHVSYAELGEPTAPGDVLVAGLGIVHVKQKDLDLAIGFGGRVRWQLLDSSGISDRIRSYALGGAVPL